jgi:hypothetical protein
MPNWKKLIVSGSDASLNSLNVSNNVGITGSLTVLNNALLGDSAAGYVIDTNTGTWLGGTPTTGLDVASGVLYDLNGNASIEWQNRSLVDVDSNTVLTWSTSSNNGVRLYGTASYALVAPPGGPDTSIQFNDSGTFSGSSNFTFNKSTNRVELTGSLNVSSSFTASGLNYPSADNGEESFIQTDGNGNLSLQYIRTIYEGIYNGEATNLIKGTPVYVSGSVGADAKVFRADPLDPSKMPAIYIAADTLGPGDTGRGVALGLINGINTTGYPAGTEIYLAPGGGWTNIRPTGSAIVQVLGYVTSEGAGGKGVILNPGPATIPNLPSGSVWVGNSDSVPVAILTSSLSVASASWANNALTASFISSLRAAGSTTQVQINKDGLLYADSGFIYDSSSATVVITGKSGNPYPLQVTAFGSDGVFLGSDNGTKAGLYSLNSDQTIATYDHVTGVYSYSNGFYRADGGTLYHMFTGSVYISSSAYVDSILYVTNSVRTNTVLGLAGTGTIAKLDSSIYYYSNENYNFNNIINVHSFTGSVVFTTGITGSLFGTSSWAQSASIAINAQTASFLPAGTYSITSSQALTASFTPNALITASVSSNVLTFTKGNGTTFNLTVNTGSGGGSTSPGGLNTYIQYRSGSSFAGNAGLTYDYVSSSLEHGLVVDATGQYSHAEGNSTTATGTYSHAEGASTQAIGVGSHAEGAGTQTPGQYSHAEGSNTTANGDRSHAEGLLSQTSGSYSHAEGYNTITYAPSSHAEGYGSITNFLIDTAVSESITLYAYNSSSGLVITDGSYPSSTTQIEYLLWTDDDNQKIYLSTLNASYVSNPDNNGSRPIFHISNYDSQGPSSNITVGGTVYKLDTATSTWGGAVNSRYPIGLLDYDNLLIEVYDTDLTGLPAFAGVVATLPSYGTYVFKVDTVNYSSNTSSITLATPPQQQIGTYDNAGSPSLTGVTTTNGHIFLTDVANTWVGGYEEGNLIVSSLSTTQQYNFVNKTFKTNTPASVYPTNSFIKTNSTITTVLGSNISASITYVTTSAQLGPIFNDTLTIQVGESSHAGGLYTETYGSYQTTVGAYNTLNNYTDLFVVGGGTDANNRKDVLAVSLNTVTISGSIIFAQPTSPAFNGEIVKFGSGTLTTGQLYFYSSSGTWSLSNANSTGSSTRMLGIAIGSSPTTNGLLIRGYAVSSSYNYGTGSIVYMATGSGTMTATPPSSSNHVVRVMGYQISANTMYFDPDKTWVTLA